MATRLFVTCPICEGQVKGERLEPVEVPLDQGRVFRVYQDGKIVHECSES